MKMKRQVENSELMAVMDWAQYNPILRKYLFHIENERKCSWAQGKRRKHLGVKKGVSDLFLAYPVLQYHGMWIEQKGPLNRRSYDNYKPARLTQEQKQWISDMINLGYYACICNGADETIKKLKWYLLQAKRVNIYEKQKITNHYSRR